MPTGEKPHARSCARASLVQRLTLALSLAAVAGCAAAQPAPSGPTHDTPLPASEPRAELKLVVSLPQREGCEEAFDLELYQDLAVEQIAWEEPHGVCQARRVTVRYLPGRTSRAALLEHIRRLAVKAEEQP